MVASVAELFPDYMQELVKQKIANTGVRLTQTLVESRSQSAQVNVYYLDRPARYSAIMLDQETVVLSVYENYRVSKIDSSATILDLTTDQGLKEYWDKEFGGMRREGRRIDLA